MRSLGTGLLIAALAGASCHFPRRATNKLTCVQEVCATLLPSQNLGIWIETTAPEGAVLHQAMLVPAGAPPCRAGIGLFQLRTESLVYRHGPMPIGGTHQMRLEFGNNGGDAVDLDVRTATGGVCVRVRILEPRSGEQDAG